MSPSGEGASGQDDGSGRITAEGRAEQSRSRSSQEPVPEIGRAGGAWGQTWASAAGSLGWCPPCGRKHWGLWAGMLPTVPLGRERCPQRRWETGQQSCSPD